MAPEAKAPWDGVERRTKQLPVGPTALKIAGRVADGGKTAVGEEDVRAGDLENTALRTRVGGILDLANSDESKPNATQAIEPAETQKPELTPEQAYLAKFKTRFDSLPQLHQGVEWPEVEKSLKADPDAMRKLQVLDEAGFEMNVFRSNNNGEIQFRTAQMDVTKIAAKYRTIMYDKQAQTDYPLYRANGNAVDLATSLGVELAEKELYEQLRLENGWVWLKTDDATRKTGNAFFGNRHGFRKCRAGLHDADSSFCAALRVKKA